LVALPDADEIGFGMSLTFSNRTVALLACRSMSYVQRKTDEIPLGGKTRHAHGSEVLPLWYFALVQGTGKEIWPKGIKSKATRQARKMSRQGIYS
jgi:hypothetical protein